MRIRDAKKEEIPLIRDQRVDAYRVYENVINEEHWQALKASISSDADSEPGVELMVAEIEGKIAGSVALFPAHAVAYDGLEEEITYPEIRVLAVDPYSRGKGVATALMEECCRRAKAKGYNSVGLHTGSFMTGAIKLYERLGFQRLPQYDFKPIDDDIIVKAFQRNL
ncbi:GNAT family N-acetyltransferase [Aquibacillus sediminis]|uniref:GNAT family N-acetyltransferase n=1 Tax=Aquibacillus sediminis TaxID=2574734 RepID=UPI001107CF05|nr:GNAT family N-acetyltransferase [Aquibacillus sediminis]